MTNVFSDAAGKKKTCALFIRMNIKKTEIHKRKNEIKSIVFIATVNERAEQKCSVQFFVTESCSMRNRKQKEAKQRIFVFC